MGDRLLSRRRMAGSLAVLAAAGAAPGKASPAEPGCGQAGVAVRFEPGPASSEWTPLQLPADQHVRVQGRIAGAVVPSILDTGATITVVDQSWAAALQLPVRDGFEARGLTAPMNGGYADGLCIRIGAALFGPLTAGVLDLSGLKGATRQDIGLVLGQDLLGSVVVEIDPARGRLRLHGRNEQGNWPGRRVTLRRTACRRHALPIVLEGRDPVDAILDVGSDAPLYVSPQYAWLSGLMTQRKISTAITAGGEGLERSLVATVSALGIAGVRFRNAPLIVPNRWNEPAPAVVGWPLLQPFRLVLDLGRDQAWLQPRPEALRDPLPRDRSGLGMRWVEGRLVIIHVAPGSPAETIGLRPGQIITRIDGAPVTLGDPRLRGRLGLRPPGTAYDLTLADGGEARLVLADYY